MSGGFGKKADRRPVDPPPIIKLDVLDHLDIPVKPRNASSSIFMIACAIRKNDFEDNKESHFYRDDGKTLACIGANVSSIHCLRDTEGKEGLYFIFPDFSIRSEGIYKIKCMLYERTATGAVFRGSVCTQPFPVQTAKQFMGMQESSALSRAFADQGIKLRIRSSPRISSNAIAAGVGKKRKNDDMAEKKYKQKSLDLEQRQFKIPADTVKLIRTSLQYSSSVHSPLNPNARSPLLAHSVPTIISSSHYHNNHYVPTPRASVSDNGGGSGYSSPKHGILEALSKPDMHTYQLPTPTLSHRSSLGSTYTSSNGSSSAPSSVPSSTHSSAPSSAASSTTSTYLPGTPAKQVRLPSFSHFLNSGKRPTLPSLSSNQVLYSLQEEPFSYEEENNIRY